MPFDEFMQQRLAVSTAFVNGEIEPLDQISARTSPATIFGPPGTTVQAPRRSTPPTRTVRRCSSPAPPTPSR